MQVRCKDAISQLQYLTTSQVLYITCIHICILEAQHKICTGTAHSSAYLEPRANTIYPCM